MPTQEQLLEEISDRIGPGDASVFDSLNGITKESFTKLSSIEVQSLHLTINSELTVATNPPPAGDWTSDELGTINCNQLTCQYTIINSGAGTGTFQIQGSLGGGVWSNIGTALSGVGDGIGVFYYNGYNGPKFALMRITFTTVVANTAEATVRAFGTK